MPTHATALQAGRPAPTKGGSYDSGVPLNCSERTGRHGGTVASAATTSWQPDCWYENPPPSPCSCSAVGLRRLPLPPDVIVVAVRWYLRFGLSYHDIEEPLAHRGVEVDHVTIYRWVLRFTPLLADAALPCRHAVGDR